MEQRQILTRLIYTSHTVGRIEAQDIKQILHSSREWNLEHDVTGILCHSHSRFLQYIEGGRGAVNDAYARIIKDNRHQSLIILDYTAIDQLEFKDWSLGFASIFFDDLVSIADRVDPSGDARGEGPGSTRIERLIESLKSFPTPASDDGQKTTTF